jgi:cell division protease FtsH
VRLAVWTALSLAALVAIFLLSPAPTDEEPTDLDYAAFRAKVAADEITSVEIHQDSGEIEGELDDGTAFTVQGPPGGLPDADIRMLDAHGVDRNYAAEEMSNPLGGILLYLLPFALLIGVLVWMSRRTTSQLTGATAFTRSRARVNQSERPATTFADVAGYETVKEEVREVASSCAIRPPSAPSGRRSPRASCWWARRAPARRSSPAPSPARPGCRQPAPRRDGRLRDHRGHRGARGDQSLRHP